MPAEYIQRLSLPRVYVRGVAKTVSCDVLNADGSRADVTDGTFSLYREGGVAVVDAQAVTVSGSVPSYTVSAAIVPVTLPRSDLWQEVWALTIGGATVTFRRRAVLAVQELYPVISDADVTRGAAMLRNMQAQRGRGYEEEREEAWVRLMSRLMNVPQWPDLILEPYTMRTPHLHLTRHIIYDGQISGMPDAAWEERAAAELALYDKAWADLKFIYDENADGKIDVGEQQRTAGDILYLGAGSGRSRQDSGDGSGYPTGGLW